MRICVIQIKFEYHKYSNNKPKMASQTNSEQESQKLKPIKFTIHHRVTVYNYTHVSFTEMDFINSLNDKYKAQWTTLTDAQRKSIWARLKQDFPFETGTHKEYDPHVNWVEAWDTEEEVTNNEKWDFHDWVKSEIVTALDTLDFDASPPPTPSTTTS
jgi:hypothetical protein